MPPAAPRIVPELRLLIAVADPSLSAADVCRLAGDAAWGLGVPRPSYEQVRQLRRAAIPEDRRVSGLQLAADILIFRSRPAWDIEPWLLGEPLPYRPNALSQSPGPRK